METIAHQLAERLGNPFDAALVAAVLVLYIVLELGEERGARNSRRPQ